MARLTMAQVRHKARTLDASLRRLETLYAAELTGAKAQRMLGAKEREQRAGRKHELAVLRGLVDELVGGVGKPETAGQIGGQSCGTSVLALQLVEPRADTNRAKVLRALEQRETFSEPGATDVELAGDTALPANSLRPRRVELVDGGWIEDSGVRRDHHGRPHAVWVLTDAARERLHPQEEPTT